MKILILDDEPKMGKILCRVLAREGHEAVGCDVPAKALELLSSQTFDVLLTDLKMPGMTGIEVMEAAKKSNPELDVIMMTAYASVETAVEALKKGAADYLIKPFHNDELAMLIARLGQNRELRSENQMLRKSLAETHHEGDLVAVSPPMIEALKRAKKVAATDVSVLLRGESGTGKEVLAALIHRSGKRSDRPFIRVNCGALPENLLESELFGHVRGAFTGAVETRKGLFQAADGGTLFLDEIGEVTPALQVKLLRVLQSGEFQRVGDPQGVKVDVRVIAATHRPLEELIQSGEFRSDLYYRLNVVPLVIPPLRERIEDIPPLIDHFLAKLRVSTGTAKRLSPEAFERFQTYPWPGNIRELQNALEHAVVMSEGDRIEMSDLPSAMQNHGANEPANGAAVAGLQGKTLEEIEKRMLHDALRVTGFNHTRAAEKLGITRRTLGYRIEKYGLPRKAKDEVSLSGELEKG